MKNALFVLLAGIILLSMPLATAQSNLVMTTTKVLTKNIDTSQSKSIVLNHPQRADEPPSWANGNFTGVWGFDIWGQVQIPLGWMFGYYKRNPNVGYFYAAFGYFGQENLSWYIQGYFFGPFMFGSLGENQSANTTLFVGIGRYNETNYHWRLMGETGPTFFMNGEYTKFD